MKAGRGLITGSARSTDTAREEIGACAAETSANQLPDRPELCAAFRRDCIDQPLAVVEDVLIDAQKRGELRSDTDRSVVAEIFSFAVAGFSTPFARFRGVSAEGVREQALALFLDGVRANADAPTPS